MSQSYRVSSIPPSIGVELVPEHIEAIIEGRPALGWFEIHLQRMLDNPNDYLAALASVGRHYLLSFYNSGMFAAIAHTEQARIDEICQWVADHRPALISENLSGLIVAHGVRRLSDASAESLKLMAETIDDVQELIGQQILLSYDLGLFRSSKEASDEATALNELCAQADCNLAFDSSVPQSLDAEASSNIAAQLGAFLGACDPDRVSEVRCGLSNEDMRTLSTGLRP